MQGEKRERYLCAVPSPLLDLCSDIKKVYKLWHLRSYFNRRKIKSEKPALFFVRKKRKFKFRERNQSWVEIKVIEED